MEYLDSGDAKEVYFQAYRPTNEPGRSRIPLPMRVLCIFVLSILGCGYRQITKRLGPTPAPNLAGLSVTSGPVGKPVTIAGTNFRAAQATSTVKFNGTAAKPTDWSATSVTAPVRSGAIAGNVTVTVGSQTSNALNPAVAASDMNVTISPVRGGVTVTQPLQVTASIQNDCSNSGVIWTSSGGTLSNQMTPSATFTAGSTQLRPRAGPM